MASLVLELQRDALNKSVNTADLLRKALVVARKLKVTDIVEWLTNELNGYPKGASVPEYRMLKGELKVHNPYHGWKPLLISNTKHAELLSKRGTSQSISELDQIAIGGNGNESVYIHLAKSIEQSLMKSMDVPLQPVLMISSTQIHGLVEKVRNTVLDWALGLEEKGIMGEGMSFSEDEQKQAGNITFNVGQLGNLIGSMQDSQLQQDTQNSTQSYTKALDLEAVAKMIGDLRVCVDAANLKPSEVAQLNSDIACVEAQLKAPKPNVGIIKESLISVRSILEGVAGSAIFQGVTTALGALV
jgi:hypothetical protein